MRKTFVIVLALIGLAACNPSRTVATATEAEVCISWGESLPARSRQDTPQTQEEISVAYADFIAACPAWADLVPE